MLRAAGRRVKAYLERYPDVSMDDIGEVAAKAYANGNLNPKAHMHAKELSPEKAKSGPEFLSNEEYRPYLRVTDCSQVSDGGAAAVFMSEEGMRKHGISLAAAVEVAGSDQGAGDIWEDPSELTELTSAKAVVGRVMDKAGVSPCAQHPLPSTPLSSSTSFPFSMPSSLLRSCVAQRKLLVWCSGTIWTSRRCTTALR